MRSSTRFITIVAYVAFNTSVVEAQTKLNFLDFTANNYPPTSGFAIPNWSVSDDGLSAGDIGNSHPTLLVGTESIRNTLISGRIYPGGLGSLLPSAGDAGGDDDFFGLALGVNQGDTENPNADFILVDWKGTDQNYNFNDAAGDPEFNNLTDGSLAAVGLAISRVRGIPTSDELWGHDDQAGNPGGGVTELARGATFGDISSNRGIGDFHDFEIFYKSDLVVVKVDGVIEFSIPGQFGDGSLGLYESHHNAGATFTDFTIEALALPGDFNLDGVQDLADYQILVANFHTGTDFEHGDFNYDDQVNLRDFFEFRTAFIAAPMGVAAVPEPTTTVMLAGSLIWLLCLRRWQ